MSDMDREWGARRKETGDVALTRRTHGREREKRVEVAAG